MIRNILTSFSSWRKRERSEAGIRELQADPDKPGGKTSFGEYPYRCGKGLQSGIGP